MKKPELLAPAGTFEKAKVAFMYGADAVYAGTSKLSLRTRTEMQFDDLLETVKYAHSLNKKIYVISKNLDNILINKYSKQYSNVTFINNDLFHDRYIILDRKQFM